MKTKEKSWFDYYKNHNGIHISNILLHWQYLFFILKTRPKRVLEIGCGPADQSCFLKKMFPHLSISLLDNDKKIVSSLRTKYKRFFTNYFVCNILDKKEIVSKRLPQYDVIYSQGLYEHFKAADFIKIVSNFAPYCKKQIISIPGNNYPNRDYGNEILRSKEELVAILKRIKGIKYKVRPYFPDIGIRTKLIKIKKEKIGLLAVIKLLLLGSLHYLIEIEKV